ncbi:MAG: glycosyltransferase family 4 protein [Verrucomicrobia bacterium]|nr:glycosyltransferase family 4 protein [Verrucomicrobiota bacterium]
MNVLYIHQHFSTLEGFTGTRSYEMAQCLLTRGHQVTMVCGSNDMANTGLDGVPVRGVRTGTYHGIHIVELHLPYANTDGFLSRSTNFLKFALRSTKIAFSTNYDLLFATSTPLTVAIPGIVMRVLKPKNSFVFEVRDLWPELPREMGVITNPIILGGLSFQEWVAYHTADACIGLSPGIVEGISRRKIPERRVCMVPNGSDLELFTPNREKGLIFPGITSDDFVAVFTGAHGIANGLDQVLDAAHILKDRHIQGIKILFIGKGKEKPHLQERVKREGLEDYCLFSDPVPKAELAKMLPKAHLGLMILANCPAFYYGTSPNKFFDYISAGLPVLNNYPGWLAEMIETHRCGLTVKPEDPEAFANALIHLASDPDLREALGRNARKLAENAFDRKKLANQWVNFLEKVYEKRL